MKIGLLNKDKLPGPKYKSEGYRIEELVNVIISQTPD